jgi:DNA-directed RNA polymerase specialized sigma24 family protein
LDDGAGSHGQAYLDMRQRLVAYFGRRHRPSPDELADDTLNRIASTLLERGSIDITPPTRYCYIVARFVLLEDLRRGKQSPVSVSLDQSRADQLRELGARDHHAIDGSDPNEQRLRCLERCLSALKPQQRALIVEYYRVSSGRAKIESRRALATRLKVTPNALSIRASRIREVLVRCVEACCKE